MPRPSKEVYIKLRQKQAVEQSPSHDWEWIAPYRALCQDCGLEMHVLLYQATARDPSRGLNSGKSGTGYLTKLVWGGNEYGIGGALKEPPCRG